MKATKAGIFLSALLFLSLACTAQSVLKKGYAFAKEASYGRELKDLEGNDVKRTDTLYFLYLELNGTAQPKITSVTFNGRMFAASVFPVKEKSVEAGALKANDRKMVLRRTGATSFWRIELTPEALPCKGTPGKGLVVKGKTGRRAFVFTAPRWTLLAPDIMG